MNTPSDTPTTPPTVSKLEIIKGKLKAAGIHFLVSLALVACVLLVAIKFWYPYDLYLLENLLGGVLIAGVVDLVVGPILTFVAYSATKTVRHLRMDLSVIAILQLSALGYGVFLFHQQSPAALALFEDTFYSATHEMVDLQSESLPEATTSLGGIPLFEVARPSLLGDIHESDKLNKREIPIFSQVFLLKPITEKSIKAYAITKTEKLGNNAVTYPLDQYHWKMLRAKQGLGAIIFDFNFVPVDLVVINP
jgi:hypothetical protein